MASTEGNKKIKTDSVSEYMVALLQLYGFQHVGSERDCMFLTWDPNILLQAVDNLNMISDKEQL